MSGNNDENVWDKQNVPSAFSSATVVDADDVSVYRQETDSIDETDAGEFPAGHADQEQSAEKKPNLAILTLAGVFGLAVLGGVGFFAKQKFFPPSDSQQQIVSEVSTQNGGSVFDAPISNARASVFEPETTKPLSASATVQISAAPAMVASVEVAPPSTSASGTVVPAKASADVDPLKVTAPVIAPIEIEAKEVPVKRATKTVKVAASSTLASANHRPRKLPAPAVVAQRKSKSVRVAKKSGATVAIAHPASETFVLERGLKVKSIYPQSGPNAQAWISDLTGKTEIVRVGDPIRGGPIVTAIIGEKGHVVTGSGVVTTLGVRE